MVIITIASLLFIISVPELTADDCPSKKFKRYCSCGVHDEAIYLGCTANSLTDLYDIYDVEYNHRVGSLVIRVNNIDTLPPSALHYNNLFSLSVAGKKLVSIDKDAFVGLEDSLTYLIFRDTGLKDISVTAISRLRKLSSLNFTESKVTSFNLPLVNMSLHSLNFARNAISSIHRGVLPSTLEILDLSNNSLLSLNGTLRGNLTILTELHISYNDISNFKGELLGTPNLKHIYAKENLIEDIDDKPFSRIPKLETLILSNNDIRKVVTGLRELYCLKELDLARNLLTELDITAFRDLISIEKLNLSRNDIKYLDETLFECCLSLRNLDISYNDLTKLDFLVSAQALNGQVADILRGSDALKCNFRDQPTLTVLAMTKFGVTCNKENNQTIHYFRLKQVSVVGYDCGSYF